MIELDRRLVVVAYVGVPRPPKVAVWPWAIGGMLIVAGIVAAVHKGA